jgi:hypothetical protein
VARLPQVPGDVGADVPGTGDGHPHQCGPPDGVRRSHSSDRASRWAAM